MKAIPYQKDAVLIQKGKIKAWVDVWIKDQDVHCDWNQYIFYLDNESDVILRKWQDNLENFEDAICLAREVLETQGIIYQDDAGKWHQTQKYHTMTDSLPIK